MKTIPVAQPVLGEEERANVLAALEAGAISGFFGDYLGRFEREFAAWCGCSHGIAVSSGTAALHVALAALEVGPGDEVLVPTLTNMATFFAVHYQGATPVPIDIETDTLNLDPALLEEKITPRTKAIMVVHLFGHPVDMDPVLALADRHSLAVIEDCAEAHGAEYRGNRVGGLGSIGCFSFYANKIITTGEGGMCTTNDDALAEKIRTLKSLAFGSENKFMHSAVGFNYRMTNLQAALGCAQMAKISQLIQLKREVAQEYNRLLTDCPELQLPVEKGYAHNVYWMYHVVLAGHAAGRRAEVMAKLAAAGIETRETFIPYNLQQHLPLAAHIGREDCPRANAVAQRGFYLPSGPVLAQEQIAHIAEQLLTAVAAT
ncbi:DegT/DnrJ/EryC1/StrS family aminotransferase [Desulfurivibrio alkaliphilus]|uniref:Glutamine--scyllo-inositol transaminase n=1 Tax=Desulfurivibrio alkaliphilus (strain DSM 19089 / UNIQEM U267 / AHT2) TaxID=589865 RepID=D6YZS5_DESAT|nr:DegT/DnrJ/EryC1/StrS family aminotransferase [Desulfurivibrio alkaliphilus]ADH85082.1 Glutamine--scyllo-inositol transaminase [Desulfurivibrio alkaliphilus AHT 2]